jgi:selenophosphate synthetase-related protein
VGQGNVVARGGGPDQECTALRSPDDRLVIAAGGPAGGLAAVVPPWDGAKALAVTQAIDPVSGDQ